MKNILLGICGISYGHINRQKPLLDHLLKNGHDVSIFTFGTGIPYFMSNYPNVEVYSAEVPYIHANGEGVDLLKTANDPLNHNALYLANNFKVMQKYLDKINNKLDLVISDYEPISAQLSYITDTPLVTIDQQSKYLIHKFEIDGFSSREESSRLNFFFPKAQQRIACSFFKLESCKDLNIVPSIIKSEIKSIKGLNTTDEIIVYESSFFNSKFSVESIIQLFSKFPNYTFNIFTHRSSEFKNKIIDLNISNITSFEYSTSEFYNILSRSKAAIANGGHGFISELMYLGKPIYCLPFPIFEQINNANIVHVNGFGVSSNELNFESLSNFISSIDLYTKNIKIDQTILYKECGLEKILFDINKFTSI